MTNRKKRAFFRRRTNWSKLYGHSRFIHKEHKAQMATYTSADKPAKIVFGWG